MFKTALDGGDRTIEAHAILVGIGFLALLAYTAWHIANGGNFDPLSFGSGCATLLGGGGVMAAGQGVLNRIGGGNAVPDDPDS